VIERRIHLYVLLACSSRGVPALALPFRFSASDLLQYFFTFLLPALALHKFLHSLFLFVRLLPFCFSFYASVFSTLPALPTACISTLTNFNHTPLHAPSSKLASTYKCIPSDPFACCLERQANWLQIHSPPPPLQSNRLWSHCHQSPPARACPHVQDLFWNLH